MPVTISGTSGITTPGISSTSASSFSADLTLAGAGVEVLNNSGRIILGQSGSVLQVVTTTVDGVLTTTTQGAPSTITNGVQVFSTSFTPISATNVILVQTSTIVVSEETNFGDMCWLALWDGSTFIAANSGTALYTHFSGALNMACLSLNNAYAAGSTSTRTISVRAGINSGAGTTYVNGSSSANYTGSSARVQMTVWEIAA